MICEFHYYLRAHYKQSLTLPHNLFQTVLNAIRGLILNSTSMLSDK